MPINKKNPGQAPRPERGGARASPTPDRGFSTTARSAATRANPRVGTGLSNAAHNKGMKKWATFKRDDDGGAFNAPASKREHPYRGSEARPCEKNLGKYSGNDAGFHGDPLMDHSKNTGAITAKAGGDAHHGSAKSLENRHPENAKDYASFADIGGSVKSNV